MRVAVCQLNSQCDREANLASALHWVEQAAANRADVIALPEYTEYQGPPDEVVARAEVIPGPTSDRFAAKARELGVWILVGSIREAVGDGIRCANTSLLFNRRGELVARYRKLHLYDVDLAGRVSYLESATVAAGSELVTAQIEGITVGLSICYDLRFPELFRLYALAGAKVLFVPASFMLYTGRDHWEVLLRARAIENQCFVVAPGQFGKYPPAGICYGRSMIIDPWGTVLSCAADSVGIAYADLDFARLDTIRAELPALRNRRAEIYKLEVNHA